LKIRKKNDEGSKRYVWETNDNRRDDLNKTVRRGSTAPTNEKAKCGKYYAPLLGERPFSYHAIRKAAKASRAVFPRYGEGGGQGGWRGSGKLAMEFEEERKGKVCKLKRGEERRSSESVRDA